jgi:hypothetical protein
MKRIIVIADADGIHVDLSELAKAIAERFPMMPRPCEHLMRLMLIEKIASGLDDWDD